MTKKSLLLPLLLCCLQTIGQVTIEWDKTFGGTDDDEIISLIQTQDGSYAVAGYTQSKRTEKSDFWLIKINAKGQRQWRKIFGGADAKVASLIQTQDGGYAMVGHGQPKESMRTRESDIWLIKTDAQGEKQWKKTFGGQDEDLATCLIQAQDGGYALAGYTKSKGAGNYDSWLVKTDANGNQQWEKTFGGKKNDMTYSLVQTSDGGYTLAGTTESKGAGKSDSWLVKTDANGNQQWEKTFGEKNNDIATCLIQTQDEGYALAGYTIDPKGAAESSVWLIKLDVQGMQQWDKTFSGTNDTWVKTLIQTQDGGYALGYTEYQRKNFWLIKLDVQGNQQWYKNFPRAASTKANMLIQTQDGNYVLAGHTKEITSQYEKYAQYKEMEEKYKKRKKSKTKIGVLLTVVGGGLFLRSLGSYEEDQATIGVGGLAIFSVGVVNLTQALVFKKRLKRINEEESKFFNDSWLIKLKDQNLYPSYSTVAQSNNKQEGINATPMQIGTTNTLISTQNKPLMGQVTSKGIPLAGTSVLVVGTSTGGITDKDGKYEINIPSNTPTLTLEFSRQGYLTKCFSVTDKTPLNISLEPSFENVDQITGTARKQIPNRYALIIGNEEYEHFGNPSHATSDSRMFREYSKKLLGIPSNNIFYTENATSLKTKSELKKVLKILQTLEGEGELYFYYAGHMEVDSKGNKCIVPTNSPNNEFKYDIKFSAFLEELFEIPTQRNLLFIDACYSGVDRSSPQSSEYLASRGGIKRQLKKEVLRGNTIMFSASGALESSNSADELNHGIFTYSLLLELKKSRGDVLLGDLSKTLRKEVAINSLKLLDVSQTPTVDYNPKLKAWKEWRIY